MGDAITRRDLGQGYWAVRAFVMARGIVWSEERVGSLDGHGRGVRQRCVA